MTTPTRYAVMGLGLTGLGASSGGAKFFDHIEDALERARTLSLRYEYAYHVWLGRDTLAKYVHGEDVYVTPETVEEGEPGEEHDDKQELLCCSTWIEYPTEGHNTKCPECGSIFEANPTFGVSPEDHPEDSPESTEEPRFEDLLERMEAKYGPATSPLNRLYAVLADLGYVMAHADETVADSLRKPTELIGEVCRRISDGEL